MSQKKDDDLDGWRLALRHYFVPLLLFCSMIVAGVFIGFGAEKALRVGVFFSGPLMTYWWFTLPGQVHGKTFREMDRTHQVRIILSTIFLVISSGVAIDTLRTFF